MPLYYFHLNFGERTLPDEEGVDLPDRAAARAEAVAVVRDLSERGAERRWAGWSLDVTDELDSFLRLPIGHPLLKLIPKDGHSQADRAEFKSCEPAGYSGAPPEGLPRNKAAALHRRLAISKHTAELLEHNRQLREELSSQNSLIQQMRQRTKQLLTSAQLVGWFGHGTAAIPDGGRPSRSAHPHLVLLPGGAAR
jgi:hypothetical protein